MREAAGALRQGGGDREAQARQSDDVARALDRIAERLGAAGSNADSETQRLSEQLARTDELRQSVEDLQRSLEALDREARNQAQSGSDGSARGPQPGTEPGSSSAARAGATGRDGSAGEQGGADGGPAGRLERLQRDAENRLRETQRLAEEMRGQSADGPNGRSTPEDWWPSLSAPGTEAFKQDFAKWESLKKSLLAAIETVESKVSAQLRQRENKARLNAGRHEAVADSYRELVDRYYESLAAGRRKPQ
jgi:hypothetical protein